MCGIIGYSGKDDAKDIIINGLQALEYRGYDSAGMAVFEKNILTTVKTTGRVEMLKEKTRQSISENTFCGIGHTRWATHGEPSEKNAHPHGNGTLMLVHNGIIENYSELKEELCKDGCTFNSDTDTEVAAKLLEKVYRATGNHIKAIRITAEKLKGSYALGIVFSNLPDTVFATKKDSPLLLGKAEKGNFISSDIAAFIRYTNRFIRLNDGEIVKLNDESVELYGADGNKKDTIWETAEKSVADTHKNGFSHFMLKEIHDEPVAMKNTFEAITKNSLPDFSRTVRDEFLRGIGRIHITACGTAFHAGLLGKHFIEKLARIPVNTQTASEFRYNDPIIDKNDLVVIISQSGETADSLAALRLMKQKGIKTLAIVNTVGSTIENESDCIIRTHAGPEVSVASTKAFNVQTLVLLMLAVRLALINGRLSENEATDMLTETKKVFSDDIAEILRKSSLILPSAEKISKHSNVFFIGRGSDSVLATEASLKLKEISYIHSEAYPAGELKHGTLSLIKKGTPVIAIATDSFFHDKMRSNIEEVRSRGAYVISVCTEDAERIINVSDKVILLPASSPVLMPFSAATALQLLAYHTANSLGRDIDKPRNLAKSVTVE